MIELRVVSPVQLLEKPGDIGSLPVLTEVLVPSVAPGGRTLWLAWDERRVPVLDDVVEAPVPIAPMRLRRQK